MMRSGFRSWSHTLLFGPESEATKTYLPSGRSATVNRSPRTSSGPLGGRGCSFANRLDLFSAAAFQPDTELHLLVVRMIVPQPGFQAQTFIAVANRVGKVGQYVHGRRFEDDFVLPPDYRLPCLGKRRHQDVSALWDGREVALLLDQLFFMGSEGEICRSDGVDSLPRRIFQMDHRARRSPRENSRCAT